MSLLSRLLNLSRAVRPAAGTPLRPTHRPAAALDGLLPEEDLDDTRLARGALAHLRSLPGVALAQYLSAEGAWPGRDRFADEEPLPMEMESRLLEAAQGRPAGDLRLDEVESWGKGLSQPFRRRGAQRLHLRPLPAWAPWPACLVLGLVEGAGAETTERSEELAGELARLLWLAAARRALAEARAGMQELRSRQEALVGEAERARQREEREVELARRRVDEAERAKNEFLSSVSHELRTPLNAIQGYTRMVLREPNLSDRQRLSLERVMTSSQNQLRLINNILDYSRLEAGRMRLELEELDLAQVLKDVVLQVEPLAAEQGLQLALELPGEAGARAVSDRAKLEQVLINLLGNAIKFTPRGRITLRLRVAAGLLHLDVADTGIGIPREEQEQIFERFRRSSITEGARKASGTGLGLAISRRLGELLGGGVALASEPGSGSTFTLTLPHFLDLETARLALAAAGEER